MKKNIGINLLVLSLAVSGLISLTTGTVLNKKYKQDTDKNKIKVSVVQKQVAKIKNNIPKLKEITIEVNEPISVKVEDYIENLDDIEEKILKSFKLDTSLVNITQAGKYTYTVNYKDKTYNGIINVKEKELPIVENIVLNELSIELGKTLPTELSAYIKTTDLSEEIKQNIKLDTSKVNINIAGDYQYTITYNNKMYTGKITIYEPQSTDIKTEIKLNLKEIEIEEGKELSKDVKDYITNSLDKETLEKLKLDTSKVNTLIKGRYEYTITYNNKNYSGNIVVK